MLLEDKTPSFFEEPFPDYNIINIAESDNETCTWPWYRRRLPQLLGTPLSILSWAFSLRFVLLLGRAVSNNFDKTKIVALCYLCIQISLLCARFVEDSWRFLVTKPRRRPRLRLVGNVAPRADIVITTCGEDLDVVMDTVKAICDLDYPAERSRVLVSDDAANPALETQVAVLAVRTPVTLLYYTRPNKGGMKAGNMNAAMKHLDSLGGAEFCAFADVDMMFEPEFLRATLPLLINDDAVGVAVVPQRFYNTPTNDPLCQSLNADGELDEPLRDSMGCAWNTGPGIVFRCRAVRDIGGFPENALAEELQTGFKLQGRGWKVAYCHEELQWGLVPDTLNAHVTQRTKWMVGRYRNACKLNCAITSPLLRDMTLKQRISAFCHLASAVGSTLNRVFNSWFFLALIATGQPLIATSSSSELQSIFLIYVLAKVTSRIEELLASASCGYFTLRRRTEGWAWLNVHLFFALVKDMLPKSLGGIRIGFTPTALSESRIQERHPDRRPKLLQRVRIMFLYQGLWMHVLVLSFAAIVFSRGAVQSFRHGNNSLKYLLTHVLVPGAEWSAYFALARPLAYAIWPPSMAERRELMECSPSRPRSGVKEDILQLEGENGIEGFEVWRPKKERKVEEWDIWALMPEVPRMTGLVFWCVVAGAACRW